MHALLLITLATGISAVPMAADVAARDVNALSPKEVQALPAVRAVEETPDKRAEDGPLAEMGFVAVKRAELDPGQSSDLVSTLRDLLDSILGTGDGSNSGTGTGTGNGQTSGSNGKVGATYLITRLQTILNQLRENGATRGKGATGAKRDLEERQLESLTSTIKKLLDALVGPGSGAGNNSGSGSGNNSGSGSTSRPGVAYIIAQIESILAQARANAGKIGTTKDTTA